MALLWFLVFGFIIGLIARAIMPGRQPMGILMTAALGIAGSFVGGVIGNLLTGYAMLALHPAGIIGSILGALLLLAIFSGVTRRRMAL